MLVNRKHSAMLAGTIAVSLFWTSSALAQDTEVEPGFYLGAGITQSALYTVGTLPISMVDLYAKAGAARIDGGGRFGDLGFQDDATEFAYGAGIRLRLQNFGIHAEYEKFDTDVIGDLDLVTLGASYSFGGSAY